MSHLPDLESDIYGGPKSELHHFSERDRNCCMSSWRHGRDVIARSDGVSCAIYDVSYWPSSSVSSDQTGWHLQPLLTRPVTLPVMTVSNVPPSWWVGPLACSFSPAVAFNHRPQLFSVYCIHHRGDPAECWNRRPHKPGPHRTMFSGIFKKYNNEASRIIDYCYC